MKKILLFVMCALVLLAFSACSKPAEEPTTQATQTVTQPTGRIYYDKYAGEYDALEKLPFYDKDDNKYYLANQQEQSFVDENGAEYDGAKCFVDTHGVFVYDENGDISLNDDGVSAVGKDNRVYYPAATVRWTNDKTMVNCFGFGREVVPD